MDAGAGLLFEDDAAIDDDVFIGDVELGDAAGDLLADEGFELGGVARAAAAGGHEGADADVDAEAAFDDLGDGAGNGDFLGEGALEGGPVAGLRDAEARELVVAFLVAAGDGDGQRVAGLDGFSVVLECRAGQNAFDLVADVEDDLIGGERDNCALELAGFGAVRVLVFESGERVGEGGIVIRALIFIGLSKRRFFAGLFDWFRRGLFGGFINRRRCRSVSGLIDR